MAKEPKSPRPKSRQKPATKARNAPAPAKAPKKAAARTRPNPAKKSLAPQFEAKTPLTLRGFQDRQPIGPIESTSGGIASGAQLGPAGQSALIESAFTHNGDPNHKLKRVIILVEDPVDTDYTDSNGAMSDPPETETAGLMNKNGTTTGYIRVTGYCPREHVENLVSTAAAAFHDADVP